MGVMKDIFSDSDVLPDGTIIDYLITPEDQVAQQAESNGTQPEVSEPYDGLKQT